MGHVRRGDRARKPEAVEVSHAVEESLTPAEQHRHQVNLHLVDQTGVQVLSRRVRPAREGDVATERILLALLGSVTSPRLPPLY